MKKFLAGLLLLTMVIMMAGCGNSNNNNSNDGTNQNSSNNTENNNVDENESENDANSNDSSSDEGTENTNNDSSNQEDVTKTQYGEYTADDPYHLVFAFVEFYEQDDQARANVLEAINEKMIPEYHMEVEFLPLSYADYQTTIQLMLSGGDELDVMPIFYAYASSWISMGGVFDMMPLMDTPEGEKIVEALGEQNAYVGNMNGVLYGFPANKESVELGGLAMRADICDELGITEEYGLEPNKDEYEGEIRSWDEAGEIFKTVKEAYPNMTPLYMSNSDQLARFVFFDELVDGFGVLNWQRDHESTEVVNKYETEEYKETVTRLADWYDKGYINADAANDTKGAQTVMKAGNTFSYASAIKPGFLAEQQAAIGQDLYALYFGEQVEGGISTTNVSFFNTSIANNSMDPEMAFKFVSAMYSDAEFYNLWQYGIEGEHYQVLDDGTAYFVEGESGTSYKYHQNSGWFLGNQFQSYVWNNGTKTAQYWDKLKKHNDWAVYSPAFGFMWDSTDYSTEITALTNAYETYRAALHTGTVGLDEVDKTISELNEALYAANLETVMEAKQDQLDAWLESQE